MDRKSGLPNEAERASYQPCLDDEDLTVASSETTAFLGEATGFSLTKRATSVRYYMMFVHGLVLGANLVFFLAVWRWSNSIMCPYGPYGPELIHTPAKEAIEFESSLWDRTNIFFRNGSTNPDRNHKQFGRPSKELDDEWERIIQYQNIRLSKEEIGEWKDHPALVQLSDGSGYYATLSVYHSIHCIKRIHHYLYFDHYYPGKTQFERQLIEHHVEHCLNVLFQTVQCNPDLTVFPMQWGATTRIPIGLDQGHHQCMNWGKIDNWMKERAFEVFTPGLIVHPTLGEAYPNGQGDDLGIALDMLLKDKLDPDHAGENV